MDPAFTLATLSRNEASVRRPDGGTTRRVGLGGELVEVGGPASFFVPEIGGRLGLTGRLEGGVQLGPMRQTLELREGILSEWRGHGVSVALAQAIGYQPFAATNRVWLRGGVDVSRWLGDWVVMSNLHVSHGTEIHAFVVNVPAPPSAAQTADGVPPSLAVRRVETRLLAALSIGRGEASAPPGGGRPSAGFYALGLVPYWVLGSREVGSECVGCAAGYEPAHFRESFGISLVFNGTVQSWW